MPNIKRTLLTGWASRLLAVVLFGAAGFVAAQQGWISPRGWPVVGSLLSRARETPSQPVQLQPIEEDPELPPELLAAQSEPGDDDLEDAEPGGGQRILPAGFDEPVVEEAEPFQESSTRDTGGAPARVAAAPEKKSRPGGAQSTRPAKSSADEKANPRDKPLVSRETIDQWIEAGDYLAAQRELSRWYWQKPALKAELLPKLNKLSQAIFFSRQPNFHETYEVAPGDQLRSIGQKFDVPWEYIARLNRVDARKIRAGQKLKVVPGPFGAVVFLRRFELTVHLGGMFVKSYPIGIGADDSTPLGTFTVKQKLVDPTYYGPDGVIRNDDPENPLGERWIDLGDSYGIHGTIEPESIGRAESRGCLRMLNRDVEEVYDLLIVGSEVRIER